MFVKEVSKEMELFAKVKNSVKIRKICFIVIKYIFSDLNECDLKMDNCAENSKCVNSLGSFICQCQVGYELRQNRCILIGIYFKVSTQL